MPLALLLAHQLYCFKRKMGQPPIKVLLYLYDMVYCLSITLSRFFPQVYTTINDFKVPIGLPPWEAIFWANWCRSAWEKLAKEGKSGPSYCH